MTASPLERLEKLRGRLADADGRWEADDLAAICRDAAAVPGLGGRTDELDALRDVYLDLSRAASDAYQTAEEIGKSDLAGSWAGAAHHAATDVAHALRDRLGLAGTFLVELDRFARPYREALRWTMESDSWAVNYLTLAAAEAAKLDEGFLHNLVAFDSAAMREVHTSAVSSLDARIRAHTAIRAAGEDFAAFAYDWTAQARTAQLDPGQPDGLTFVDRLVLTEAGGDLGDEQILSASAGRRAGAAISAMSPDDRRRLIGLLSEAASPEHKAYLLKVLAAGYPLDEVSRFNDMIAPHGADPEWLDRHLSPLAMDAPIPGRPIGSGKEWAMFGNRAWEQGNYPTCVAASTVTARAEVDPLYALRLTTGGHPGDPAFDNPAAFADRLRDEQVRVYDGGRLWYENWGEDGMTDAQSDRIADEEIAPYTGARYDDVDMRDNAARESVLRSVERAVDDGYPVPFAVAEGDSRHQMMIIGHAGDQVQIYNPWGYSYWVSEEDFVQGRVDGIDAEIPSTPVSVRLPETVR